MMLNEMVLYCIVEWLPARVILLYLGLWRWRVGGRQEWSQGRRGDEAKMARMGGEYRVIPWLCFIMVFALVKGSCGTVHRYGRR